MSRFLRALAKVGLVDLDEQEAARLEDRPSPGVDETQIARILAEEEERQPSPEVIAPPGTDQAPASAEIEGRSFDEIYQDAQLPRSPFPAEKLLKLLDGLRAMDPATRKAAVIAMDAADEAWTIEDALLDAERKTRALRLSCERVQALANQAEERGKQELAALDDYVQKAAETIRKQIADLEKLMHDELQKAADKKAQAQADARSAQQAAARERARYEQEIARLAEIPTMFGQPVEPHDTKR